MRGQMHRMQRAFAAALGITAVIHMAQIDRDRMRLKSNKVTVREKERIRGQMGGDRAGAGPESHRDKADISTLPES